MKASACMVDRTSVGTRGVAAQRGKCSSATSLRSLLILMVSALVAARLLLELLLPRRFAASLPVGPQDGCEDEVRPFWVVVQAELPAIDHVALQKELMATTWTGKTWLVKVLSDEGATDIRISPWASHRRNMTFSLGLGIPWDKVHAFLRMQKTGSSSAAPAVLEDAEQFSSVEASHTVQLLGSGDWGLRSTYSVPGVSVKLDIDIDFRRRRRSGHKFVQYKFSAKMQFTDKGPGNIFSYGFIRRSMELGFGAALRRFGLDLLAEVKARPSAARNDRLLPNAKVRP